MEVVKSKEIELCLDGTMVVETCLDKQISKEFIFAFKKLGELEYFPQFARPFFKIILPDGSYVKGVEMNFSMRIHYVNKSTLEKINYFINNVELE